MHITAAEACQEEPLPSTQVQQTWDYMGPLHIQCVQDNEGYYETIPTWDYSTTMYKIIGLFFQALHQQLQC